MRVFFTVLALLTLITAWLWHPQGQSVHESGPVIPEQNTTPSISIPEVSGNPSDNQSREELLSDQPEPARLVLKFVSLDSGLPMRDLQVSVTYKDEGEMMYFRAPPTTMEERSDDQGLVAFARFANWECYEVRVYRSPNNPPFSKYLNLSITLNSTQEHTIPIRENGYLRGRVIDLSGNGISDAEVHAKTLSAMGSYSSDASKLRLTARTNGFGYFEIAKVAGRVRLEAEKDDHFFVLGAEIDLNNEIRLEDIVLILAPSIPLNGTVVTHDGQPVKNIRVTVQTALQKNFSGAEGPYYWPKLLLRRETNRDGAFHFDRVPVGSIYLSAYPKIFPSKIVPIVPDGRPVELVLDPPFPTATIAGTVHNLAGQPIPGATVYVRNEKEKARILTDKNGFFETGLMTSPAADKDSYLLVGARSDSYAPAGEERDWAKPGKNRFDLVLGTGLPMKGTIFEEDGQPAVEAKITLTPTEDDWKRWPLLWHVRNFRAETDSNGRFDFQDLSAGEYLLQIEPHHNSQSQDGSYVAYAGDEDLSIHLGRFEGDLVRQRLIFTGIDSTTSQAHVTRTQDGGFWRSQLVGIPQDGVIAMEPIRPANFKIMISVDGFAPWVHPQQFWPAGEHDIHVSLTPATELKIRFVDSLDKPVAGVSVELFPAEEGERLPLSSSRPDLRRRTLSGPDGRIWLFGLPQGSVKMHYKAPGGSPQERWFQLTASVEPENVIQLDI